MGLLPTVKSKPKANLHDYTILIYGAPKLGKSTFVANAEDVVILATEPGLNALECYKVDVPDWETFLSAASELAEMNHGFKAVGIDTGDNLFGFLSAYLCKKHNVSSISDLDNNKGYGLLNNEFQRVLTKLAHLPMGLIITSHEKNKEFKNRDGSKFNKIVPSISGQGADIVCKLADIILYADIDLTTIDGKPVTRRVVRTKPHPAYTAGDRTRRLPAVLPLSYSVLKSEFESPEADARAAAALERDKRMSEELKAAQNRAFGAATATQAPESAPETESEDAA